MSQNRASTPDFATTLGLLQLPIHSAIEPQLFCLVLIDPLNTCDCTASVVSGGVESQPVGIPSFLRGGGRFDGVIVHLDLVDVCIQISIEGIGCIRICLERVGCAYAGLT